MEVEREELGGREGKGWEMRDGREEGGDDLKER